MPSLARESVKPLSGPRGDSGATASSTDAIHTSLTTAQGMPAIPAQRPGTQPCAMWQDQPTEAGMKHAEAASSSSVLATPGSPRAWVSGCQAPPHLRECGLGAPPERGASRVSREGEPAPRASRGRRATRPQPPRDASALAVELQVETMTTCSSRVFLYSWYAILLTALLVQSLATLQWEVRDLCTGHRVSFAELDGWNSSRCVRRQTHWVPVHSQPSYLRPVLAGQAVVEGEEGEDRTYHGGGLPHGAGRAGLGDVEVVLWDEAAFAAASGRLGLAAASASGRDAGVSGGGAACASAAAAGIAGHGPVVRPTIEPHMKVYHIQWTASRFGALMDQRYNRFMRAAVNMRSPMNSITPAHKPERRYRVVVALEEIHLDSDESSESGSDSGRNNSSSSSSSSSSDSDQRWSFKYAFNTTVTCRRDAEWCDTLVLPPIVGVFSTNSSNLTVTLLGVNAELGEAAAGAVVGFVYQRAPYTVVTVVWRYGFMVYSLLNLARFLYLGQRSGLIYEQYWVVALQLGVVLYLDPLFLRGMRATSEVRPVGRGGPTTAAAAMVPVPDTADHVLSIIALFAEFHIPNYFAALCVSFGFAVIAASFVWQGGPPSGERRPGPSATTSGTALVTAPCTSSPLRSPSPPVGAASRVRPSPRPRRRFPRRSITAVLVGYVAVVVALDVATVFLEQWRWGTEAVCVTPACRAAQAALRGWLVAGVLGSCVALFLLRRSLNAQWYLETRAQQLACRTFIFVFLTAWVYVAAQVALVRAVYPRILDVIYFQPLTQLSPLMVGTFFVNHMTYIYTTTRASKHVPPRPNTSAWKRMVWTRPWFQWLRWHGGSQYIFLSEREERLFDAIQSRGAVPSFLRPRTDGGFVRPTPPSAPAHAAASRQGVGRRGRDGRRRGRRAAETGETLGGRLEASHGSEQQQQKQQRRCIVDGAPVKDGEGASAGDTTAATAEGVGSAGWPSAPAAAGPPTAWPTDTVLGHDGADRGRQWAATSPPRTPILRGARSCPPTPRGGRGPTASWVSHVGPPSDDDADADDAHEPRRAWVARSAVSDGARSPSPSPSSSSSLAGDRSGAESSVVEDGSGPGGGGQRGGWEEDLSFLPPPSDSDDEPSGREGGDGAADDVAGAAHLLSRGPRRVWGALQRVEHAVVAGAAEFVDRVEGRVVEGSQQAISLARRLRSGRGRGGGVGGEHLSTAVLPRWRTRGGSRLEAVFFFNLETAIDCFNMAWEAYAVVESRGDGLISTGFDVGAGGARGLVEQLVMRVFEWYCARQGAQPLLPPARGGGGPSPAEGEGAVRVEVAASAGPPAAITDPESLPWRAGGHPANTPTPTPALATPPPLPTPIRRLSFSPLTVERDRLDTLLLSAAAARTATGPAPTTTTTSPVPAPYPVAAAPPAVPRATPTTAPTPRDPAPPGSPHHSMNPERFGYKRVAVFEARGVQVVITRMDRNHPLHRHKHPRLVVAFRGTDNAANLMQDVRVRRRAWREMGSGVLGVRATVHSGFLEPWMALKRRVLSTVLAELRRLYAVGGARGGGGLLWDGEGSPHEDGEEGPLLRAAGSGRRGGSGAEAVVTAWAAPPSQRMPSPQGIAGAGPGSAPAPVEATWYDTVYVTGHSLGGALACLCAYSLRRLLLLAQYPNPELVVYTYGQPRLGNDAFRRVYNSAIPQTFRVVNESDAVTGLNVLGGHHVGTEVDIDRHGNFIARPISAERLFQPVRGRTLQAMASHSMAAYGTSLNAIADRHAPWTPAPPEPRPLTGAGDPADEEGAGYGPLASSSPSLPPLGSGGCPVRCLVSYTSTGQGKAARAAPSTATAASPGTTPTPPCREDGGGRTRGGDGG